MILYSSYKTGEICPQSGYWYHTETKEVIPLSKGEHFPTAHNTFARWKLKEAINLEPIVI